MICSSRYQHGGQGMEAKLRQLLASPKILSLARKQRAMGVGAQLALSSVHSRTPLTLLCVPHTYGASPPFN